jgi:archaeosine synthase
LSLMEIYLEILKHSGPGRLGKVHLGEKEIITPNFLHFPSYPGKHDIYLAGSNSRTKKKPVIYDHGFFEKRKIRKFGILPDFPVGFDIPLAIAEEAAEETLKIARQYPDHGAVITGAKFPELIARCAEELKDRPLLVIANGQRLATKPRLLAEIVPRIREIASPNTALYFPFAPPVLFPVMAYMGVDFFDSAEAVLRAEKRDFLTPRGFKGMGEIGRATCYCRACRGRPAKEVIENSKALLEHNLNFIRGAVSEIREAMTEDRLRELVEEKSGYDARAMALLRILDHEKSDYLERYTPIVSRSTMRFISQESYNRPEVKRWQRRLKERYAPPRGKKLSVILPCSARKPYHKSRSHMLFRKYIRRGAKNKLGLVHEVSVTSPLGIVPRELEGLYPASRYDIPVTGHWTRDEKALAVEQLTRYLSKAKTKAISHVDGAYREICAAAGAKPGKERILSKDSLEHLSERLSELLADESMAAYDKIEGVRRVCEYQFGHGAGEHLLPMGADVRRYQLFYKGEQVAAINPGDGLLALTLRGGELLAKHGKYLVDISFEPKTDSVFCVGVEKAGEEIRPGDEVIVVYDGEVVGVGKALLNGTEMTRAMKGLAVKLRHRR